MGSRAISIITGIVFITLSWFIYILYPFIQNLIFAILISTVSLVTLIVYYLKNIKTKERFEVEKGIDKTRVIFTGIAFILFLVFFGLSIKFGGSAASDEYASWRYEYYEVGQYYLSSHGNFTLVTYSVWIRMKIVEQVTMTLFSIAVVWNFFHIAKTKGMKYILTGRNKDISEYRVQNTISTKIGFVLLSIFMIGVVGLIIFSLFIV